MAEVVEKSFFLFWSLYGCGDFSPTGRDHPLPLASEHLSALPLFGGQDELPLGGHRSLAFYTAARVCNSHLLLTSSCFV